MRMMGAESVAYHRETVMGRADDHPGGGGLLRVAGETPLVWGGSGAEVLGLEGAVTDAEYDGDLRSGRVRRSDVGGTVGGDAAAGDGVGGRRTSPWRYWVSSDGPRTCTTSWTPRRDATLGLLDDWRAAPAADAAAPSCAMATWGWCSPTPGMPRPGPVIPLPTITCWSRTWSRCATSGAGGRRGHDVWREYSTPPPSPAASRAPAGRSSSATGSNPTTGPSGRLGQWRIAGIPVEAGERVLETGRRGDAAMAEGGVDSYRARQVAARTTRRRSGTHRSRT